MKKVLMFFIGFALFSCGTTSQAKVEKTIESKIEKVTPQKLPDKRDAEIEKKVNAILAKMTLREKIGQTALRGTSSRSKVLPEEIKVAVREGKIGAMLNVMKKEYVDELQKIAVEESKHGIPLIFARDVIHGFKTIFPIPLGIAASWDPSIAETGARVSAEEASKGGIRWTFAPMLDISRDSRWGRVAESPGEDPYLGIQMAKGYVKGFQGDDLSDPTSMAACAKHLIGYGAGIGGRDYNTVDISNPLMRNVYMPPFAAALDAGAVTVMSSFNEINGVPATGSKKFLDDILRGELGFDGFVVSDWNSVTEMIPHGYASDEKHAAERAAYAGLDMEMTSKAYDNHLEQLIKEGVIPESRLDFYVKNILRTKFRLGLMEMPYVPDSHPGVLYSKDNMKKAKDAAIASSVLLKNNVLPLPKNKTIALIGPLAHKGREQLGTWTFDGEGSRSVTPMMAFHQARMNFTFTEGLSYSRDKSRDGFAEAIEAAKASDYIVFIGGEEAILSGEAHSRADISLPGIQEELINELAKTGKPIILVIMAGRPITITSIIDKVDAVLMTWAPGTMGGPAIQEMIVGSAAPAGRLPITWPKTAGQLPLFYNHKNTGRPPTKESFVHIDDIEVGAWQSSLGNNSHYLDAGFEPHFPFGFGLSYTSFEYSDIKLSKSTISKNEDLTVSVTITNTGKRKGSEVAQLYIQDVVGSITRPVRELKGYKKVSLNPGESKTVEIILSPDQLSFVNGTGERVLEAGDFNIWVSPDSASGEKMMFKLID